MKQDILIGLDAGTSVIKAAAFDLVGNLLGTASRANHYRLTRDGGAEQDMARTWSDLVATLVELGQTIDNLSARTVGISVTAQGDGTWLMDRDGEPVGDGWLWLDARAGDRVARMRGSVADRQRYQLTGTGLAACQQGSQLALLQEQNSPLLDRATTAFHCKDWLYYKLTNIRAVDPSEAVFTFGNYRTRDYSTEVIEALGLLRQQHLLPEIVDGATQFHPLSPEAAKATGLKTGTPVVLGYVDVICTALGSGLYDPGNDAGCTIIGSTGMNMRLAKSADDVFLNDELTGYVMCMPIPGVYAQMQSSMAATLNIDWILGLAADVLKTQGIILEKPALIALCDQWLDGVAPSHVLYHPYISDAGERGPFVDATAHASLTGLSMSHGFGDLVRAVYDGLALAARDCYTAMGPLPKQVRLSGGAARSAPLRRILGSALGASIQTSMREEAGAAGTAMIAAVCLGLNPTMANCVHEWVRPSLRPPEAPDDALAEHYTRTYPIYRQTREALTPVWHSMAEKQD